MPAPVKPATTIDVLDRSPALFGHAANQIVDEVEFRFQERDLVVCFDDEECRQFLA